MNKKYIILILFFTYLFSSEIDVFISQKLAQLNYSQDEINLILQKTSLLIKNDVPKNLIIKLVNEAVIKRVPFNKFYPVVEKYTSDVLLAKSLIEKVKTSKFQPKDYEYCIATVVELINSGVTAEEYIKLMSLLSNNYTFDDATAVLNYYLVFKKNFSVSVIDKYNNKILTPYEVLFLKYYTRPIKELSMITKNVVKYFSISRDVNEIYQLLFDKAQLPTHKLLKEIQMLCDKKVKQEIKQEVEHEKKMLNLNRQGL